jgi:kynurenine formamidase
MPQLSHPPAGALPAHDPAALLAALRLVRRGALYDLGVDLGNTTPRLPPAEVAPFILSSYRTPGSFAARPEMQGCSFSSEVLYGGIHQGCHMDALIHAQRHGRVYGGAEASRLLTDQGWIRHGMETVPPIVLPAVLLDLATYLGADPVPDGRCLGVEELAGAAAAQNAVLTPGVCVLLRTGKIRQYATDRLAFEAGCPGISGRAAAWLAERGMVCFALDATSADPHPTPDWNDTAHEELLVRRGIHIIENVYLEELAREGVRECLFFCLPLRIRGATGSWVRPIALA